jgi:hypothetical protein
MLFIGPSLLFVRVANEETHFFSVVLFGSTSLFPRQLSQSVWLGTFALSYLSFLCVAGRACLSKLTVEGRGWEGPKKDDSKNLWASSDILPLRFSPMQLRICYTIHNTCLVHPREYWMIYRGPGFLAIVWFGSFPPPSPPPSLQSVSTAGDTQEAWERESIADGRGGWRRS